MSDERKNEISYETCLENLCYPYTGFEAADFAIQERAKNILLGALHLIGKYLDSLPRRVSGPVEAANRTLIVRAINDLMIAFHALSAGYYVQGLNLLRPILETANLIILFQKEPERVDAWLEGGDRGRRELSAAKVREILYGKDGIDPFEVLYSHFCEAGSHPRFKGTQSYVFMKSKGEEGDKSVPEIVAFIGGSRAFPLHTLNLLNCISMPSILMMAIFQAYPLMLEVDQEAMFGYFGEMVRFAEHLPESQIGNELIGMVENIRHMKDEFEKVDKLTE